MIEFRKVEREGFILVEFELSGPISPDVFSEVLNKLEKLNLRYDRGIVVSGLWLYCFIFHRLHLGPPSSCKVGCGI